MLIVITINSLILSIFSSNSHIILQFIGVLNRYPKKLIAIAKKFEPAKV